MPMPTMSPGPTVSGLNFSMDSSTRTGSPTSSAGVDCAITKSHRGVIKLYPAVDMDGLIRTTFAILPPFAAPHGNTDIALPGLPSSSPIPNPHQSPCPQVSHRELRALPRRLRHGFRRQISAADGAFHGGGPSGTRPIAGQEDARPARRRWRTVGVRA